MQQGNNADERGTVDPYADMDPVVIPSPDDVPEWGSGRRMESSLAGPIELGDFVLAREEIGGSRFVTAHVIKCNFVSGWMAYTVRRSDFGKRWKVGISDMILIRKKQGCGFKLM